MASKNLNNKAVRKSTCGTRQGWKKPKGSPKQPLSAYNLFYQYERQRILNGSSDATTASGPAPVGFAPLTRCIADKWKQIDPTTRLHFEKLAALDKTRYIQEKKEWNSKMQMQVTSMMTVPSSPSLLSNFSIGVPDRATSAQIDNGFINHKVAAFSMPYSDDDDSSSHSNKSDETSLETFKSQQMRQLTLQNMACVQALGEGASISSEMSWDDDIFEDRASSPVCLCPVPLSELMYHTSISQLASTLDDDSIDMLMGLLD